MRPQPGRSEVRDLDVLWRLARLEQKDFSRQKCERIHRLPEVRPRADRGRKRHPLTRGVVMQTAASWIQHMEERRLTSKGYETLDPERWLICHSRIKRDHAAQAVGDGA